MASQNVSQFEMTIIPSESTALALIDSSLYILASEDLKPTFNVIQGVVCFTTDRKLQSPLQIAVGGKRAISILLLDSHLKLDTVKHIEISENAVVCSIFVNLS